MRQQETLVHVFEKCGEPLTTSIDVAEKFNKRHDNVIRSINRIAAENKKFALLNFEEISYMDERNRKQPMFEMTRSGFSVLAMGFTGREALGWKIKYEQAFSTMEQTIINDRYHGFVSIPDDTTPPANRTTTTLEYAKENDCCRRTAQRHLKRMVETGCASVDVPSNPCNPHIYTILPARHSLKSPNTLARLLEIQQQLTALAIEVSNLPTA